MNAKLDRIVTDQDAVREASKEAFYAAKALVAAGKRAQIVVQEAEDPRTLQQLRWYWGVLLKATAEQVTINDARYTADAWHELMKKQFIKPRRKLVTIPGEGDQWISEPPTTKGLSVAKMSAFLEEASAWAQTDLNVRLPVEQWQDYAG